jgi:hypothetical protein
MSVSSFVELTDKVQLAHRLTAKHLLDHAWITRKNAIFSALGVLPSDSWRQSALRILGNLKAMEGDEHDFCEYFHHTIQPHDPLYKNYREFVKEPVFLDQLEQYCASPSACPIEFGRKLQLVWTNALTYNPQLSKPHHDARKLQSYIHSIIRNESVLCECFLIRIPSWSYKFEATVAHKSADKRPNGKRKAEDNYEHCLQAKHFPAIQKIVQGTQNFEQTLCLLRALEK